LNPDSGEEHEEEEASVEDAPKQEKGGHVAWELLQKGLKKAMGPTRDQLEFDIKIRSMFDGFDDSGDGMLTGDDETHVICTHIEMYMLPETCRCVIHTCIHYKQIKDARSMYICMDVCIVYIHVRT